MKIKQIVLLIWVMQGCFTLEDVTKFLNTLTPYQSKYSKVIAINSQRSFMGALSTPYYVFYPQETPAINELF